MTRIDADLGTRIDADLKSAVIRVNQSAIIRVKITLQYKGTRYNGWQVQPNGKTIQEILGKSLRQILQKKINVVGSGRTDSGVHALGQVCHFDIDNVGAPPRGCPSLGRHGDLPLQDVRRILHGLNSLLPDDISVIDARIVDQNFHAQKSAKRKIYDYYILNSFLRSPFLHDYVWRIPYPLAIKKMRQAGKRLMGEHDFKSFCAADSTAKTTVRRVYRLTITPLSPPPLPPFGHPLPKGARVIRITVIGNGFLKHMVRNIVGTLVAVGRGKMTLTEFKKVFQGRDRRKAGITAPAKGLMLREVIY